MNPFRFKMNPVICSVGGDDPVSSSTIRYADYVETKHSDFLTAVQTERLGATGNSPYVDYESIDTLDDAFFGANYIISDFPSWYDMYGKFVAGLDIDTLFDQVFESTVNSPEVNALMAAESALMQDEIEMNILPTYELGARDLNSVMSSVYVIEGANVMGDAKIKALAKYEAQLRYNLIPLATQRWQTHLTWNQNVIAKYTDVIKLYYAAKMDVDNFNTNMGAKDTLWPFTVLEYERAALGALTGAKTTSSTQSSGDSGLGGILGIASTVLGMF